ncbi:MAG: galactosyltransferase-related protein [Bacteroidota bacterium]
MEKFGTKINLSDVSFLIPVRLDSIDRLENIEMCCSYLMKNFNTNIKILEGAAHNNKILRKLLNSSIDIVFEEDADPVFHRTRYINQMVKTCQTRIIAVWDTDVIVPAKQIADAVELIRKGEFDFTYPYKNKFYETSLILRKHYLQTGDINVFESNQEKMKRAYMPDPVGGGFFALKSAYSEAGMENENFYGWGVEDGERINRWNKLGYKVKHVEGALYHLTHQRGANSVFQNNLQRQWKREELKRLFSMSKEELSDEIKSWKHI